MNPPEGHHFFAQDEVEFNRFMEILKTKDIRSLLEVGSRFGQSLLKMSEAVQLRGRIVSVDLGHCVDSRFHSGPWLYQAAGYLAEQFDMHLILGDSHDPKIVSQVAALGPYDLVFIDGDHSEEGVNLDWINYGVLAKKIVAFHDITIPHINKLYKSIEGHKEYIHNDPVGPGIGMVYK